MSYIQSNQIIKLTAAGAAASYNVVPADSGKTFLIPALGAGHALTINLPNVQAGLSYRFMAAATLASAATLTPTNGQSPYTPINGLINGSLYNIADTQADAAGALQANEVVNDSVQKAAANTAVLTAAAIVGSFIDINSDGNAWYVIGMSPTVAGLA